MKIVLHDFSFCGQYFNLGLLTKAWKRWIFVPNDFNKKCILCDGV